jgi:transcription elongation GreA/GreB family factor
MSRAFVRESDGEAEPVPERPVEPQPNYVTVEGYERLSGRAAQMQRELAQIDGSEVTEQVGRAQLERDLQWLRARLRAAVVVPAAAGPREHVAFGATVEVEVLESGERQRYRIVGADEVDAASGNVSWASPLGRALMGARPGDVVCWERPAGELEMEVMAIR